MEIFVNEEENGRNNEGIKELNEKEFSADAAKRMNK